MAETTEAPAVSPEVQEQIARFLTKANDAVEKGSEFVVEQAPLVIQEMITFGRACHTGAVLAGLLGLLAVYLFVKKKAEPIMSVKGRATTDLEDFTLIAGSIASLVLSVVSIATICCNVEQTIKVWFAPRLYILEKLGDLL
jgi:hypothetical protein